MDVYSIFRLDFGLNRTSFARCFRLNFRQIYLPFMSWSVKARIPNLEWKIRTAMSECGSNSSSRSSFLPFPFIWLGRNEGLKIIEMSSNFYQGTTTTHTTLQASQSLFDLVVTEISDRNEISIQSLLKIQVCNDVHVSGYLIYSLRAWISCALT